MGTAVTIAPIPTIQADLGIGKSLLLWGVFSVAILVLFSVAVLFAVGEWVGVAVRRLRWQKR